MFKKLTADAILPKRQTRFSAGFDVFANEDKVIPAGQTELIGLGIAIDKDYLYSLGDMGEFNSNAEFLQRHYFALHIRSSLRVKGLTSLGTGVIDMDFDQEVKMVINNPMVAVQCIPIKSGSGEYIGDEYKSEGFGDLEFGAYEVKKGDKIGQLILLTHAGHLMPSEYTLDNERVGGFGSSGAR